MTFEIRSLPLQILVLFVATASAACESRAEQNTPIPAAFFIPEGATNVQHHDRQGISEVNYDVDAPYPAATFVCELTRYLDQHKWRGLREDALNPGTDSSLVSGWGDFGNATRQPETRVHVWMAEWRNEGGDLLTYGLRYEYPATAPPELRRLNVSALVWPANFVRAQLGERADRLPAVILPAPRDIGSMLGDASSGRRCEQPHWTELVKSKSAGTEPVQGSPFELAGVRSIDIESDIDGLAGRMAAILAAKVPDLRVRTVHDRVSGASDATLDFRAECRCNEGGTPNGFYVREAVLYKNGIQREWTEPPRVLFYWTDAGVPAWKSQVPGSCIAQKAITPSCKTAFEHADVAFADGLASALNKVQGRH